MRLSKFFILLLLLLLSASVAALGKPVRPVEEGSAVRDVAKLARAISLVQPRRSEQKYVKYALAIYHAANRYKIEPAILVAIAQQETSFRENLPEGRAGELGICQVLKRWARNPAFRKEFGHVTAKDFKDPAKNFLFAAWILRQLKDQKTKGALPYWSYYNARRFENRFRYYLAVNRYLSTLKRFEHEFKGMSIAFMEQKPRAKKPSLNTAAFSPAMAQARIPASSRLSSGRHKVTPEEEQLLVAWVPQALQKIQQTRTSHKKSSLLFNPYVMSAGVGGGLTIAEAFFGKRIQQD